MRESSEPAAKSRSNANAMAETTASGTFQTRLRRSTPEIASSRALRCASSLVPISRTRAISARARAVSPRSAEMAATMRWPSSTSGCAFTSLSPAASAPGRSPFEPSTAVSCISARGWLGSMASAFSRSSFAAGRRFARNRIAPRIASTSAERSRSMPSSSDRVSAFSASSSAPACASAIPFSRQARGLSGASATSCADSRRAAAASPRRSD